MDEEAKTLVRRWTRALVRGAGVVFLIAVFTSVALDNSYVTYPIRPDPSVDRIVPHEVKGIVVYITEDQHLLMQRLGRIKALGWGLALICFIYSELPARLR